MKSCITCLFQGDNNVDVNGDGKVFCMVDCKWKKEQDSCNSFVEYADLSKEIRAQYALAKNSGNNSISIIIKKEMFLVLCLILKDIFMHYNIRQEKVMTVYTGGERKYFKMQ